ncbi:MAG: Rne/Rng family ribonuclease [Armatimonadota bacterium]|nr:MAG: Rne/Rng family ribonuclease [Armatimonadota bacterium]
MRKEIIVNADDLESRVAILEDGELAELNVEREPRMVGSVYKARVLSVLPGMDAAFADVGLDKNVFLCADDVGFVSRDGVTVGPAPRSLSIAQRLKESQEVVVQIIRAPVGGKGARATTRLALPGRYLVMLVSDVRQVGVSRRIEDRKERARLRKIGERIRREGVGIIIRTEAEGHGRRELESDLKVLLDLRERLMKKAAQAKAPALLHQDLTLTYQVIRDAFTEDVSALVIDSKSGYDNAVELVRSIAPRLRRRVKRYRGKLPIFHKYGIEGEIDRLLRRRVWLAAGGYISIDQTEAFTAIDVNTGRYTGSTGLADTILRTNLEAAREVARQLRLRDLGGIIVIDFIDMDRSRHRQRVMKAFEEALKRDRQKTKILHLSPLGLIEMTRKRRGESLMGVLTETCPHCAGLGRMRRPITVALKIEREISRLAAEEKVGAVMVRATPRVAAGLIGEGGLRSAALDRRVGGPVYIRADHALGVEDHEIIPLAPAQVADTVKLYTEGEEVVVDHLDSEDLAPGEDAYGWASGYRVQIEGGHVGVDGQPVILTEVGSSFARGRLRSAKPKPEKPQRGKGSAPRRASRKRSRSKRKPKSAKKAAPAAKGAAEAAPRSAEERAPEPPSAVPAKKSGLLRRGARRIARVRR